MSITNCLATKRPDIAAEWHPTLNGTLAPRDVFPGAPTVHWWLCERGHAWKATANHRTHASRPRRCTECVREDGAPRAGRARTLAELYPERAAEWHPTKNGALTPSDVVAASKDVVWWQCSADDRHAYPAPVNKRAGAKVLYACPYCRGKLALREESLGVLRPDIATEWHPTKNGERTAFDVTPSAQTRYWWKCPVAADHEWPETVARRTEDGAGCSACGNRRLSVTNRLDLLFPDVAAEWHPSKNKGVTPDRVIAGSGTPYWWLCGLCGNEWKQTPERRTRLGTGCRECGQSNVSKEEIHLAHELAEFLPVDLGAQHVVTADGRSWRVDIVVPEQKIAVEYDGAYWHADKAETDLAKSRALEADGWTVLRVREKPLEALSGVWCVPCTPVAYKKTATRVVVALAGRGLIGAGEAAAYAKRRSLVNGEAARQVIRERAVNRAARAVQRLARTGGAEPVRAA